MTVAKRPAAASSLAKEVRDWIRAEAGDRELQERVSAALDEIKEFITSHQSDLERRKSRLIQTPGFKDETRNMEAALGKIQLLVTGGRNISLVSAEIGAFLDTYKENATFDREHVRTQLADARDDFFHRYHEAIRGTSLAGLLDILYFMPFSYWRSRSVEQRNYRSPSATELSKLFEDFRHRSIDADSLDTVTVAAMIRIRLGITPRMDFHRMPANKLAERLTSAEVIARSASGGMPLTESFSRTVAGILINVRRWMAELFVGAPAPAPPELEAEMVQIAYLASDTIRLGGTGSERAADFLWLLATVIASDHAVAMDVLAAPIGAHVGHASIRARIEGLKQYVDEISGSLDAVLASRWSEARDELGALTVRTDAITAKGKQEFRDFTELEELKEKRSDVVKSLLKLSDALQLVELPLLDRLAPTGAGAGRLATERTPCDLDQAQLRDRNYRISEETKTIARQELEKLRLLIQRMTAISRAGFAESVTAPAPQRPQDSERRARQTSDGVELAELSGADLAAKLCGALQKMAGTLRELRGKVDGVRRRILKSELQHALNLLHERTKKAADTCESLDADAGDEAGTSSAAESVVTLLKDIMAAQTNVAARMNATKLTPAEKQPLAAMMNALKLRIGDDLRDIERMRAELLDRSKDVAAKVRDDAHPAAVDAAAEPETAAAAPGVGPEAAADAVGGDQATPAETAGAAPEDPARAAAAARIAVLVAAANDAQRPVKTRMRALSETFTAEPEDSAAIRAAAAALLNASTEARDVMTANAMQIETLAAGFTLATDRSAERFDRWRGQLTSLERETERLLRSMARVAGVRDIVATAAALEQGIADTLRPPPGERRRTEPFVPVRQLCREALATIAQGFREVREVRQSVAAASDAEWRILKSAARHVERLGSELGILEQGLQAIHGRIEAIHNHFKSDRPRTG